MFLIQHFAHMLEKEFKVTFPAPNLSPLLWRSIRNTGLPRKSCVQ